MQANDFKIQVFQFVYSPLKVKLRCDKISGRLEHDKVVLYIYICNFVDVGMTCYNKLRVSERNE